MIAGFVGFIIHSILFLLILALVVNAVLSWLVAFDVINRRNQAVYNVINLLDAVTRPVLAPFRRFIPPLGGVDITPVIVIILLSGIDKFLVPLIVSPLLLLP